MGQKLRKACFGPSSRGNTGVFWRHGNAQLLRPDRLHPRIFSVILDAVSDRSAEGVGEDAPALHATHVARDLDIDLVFREAEFEEGLETEVQDGL